MRDGEPLIWFSNSDDPGNPLLRGIVAVTAAVVASAVLAGYLAGQWGLSFATLALPLLIVPIVGAMVVRGYVTDRRAVVEIRLSGGELTVVRVDGTSTTYPLRDVRRVRVDRTISLGSPSAHAMRVYAGRAQERTRTGPDRLPDG